MADRLRRGHGAVTVEIRGLARLNRDAATWVGAALGGLPEGAPGPPDVSVEVAPVPAPGRRAEHGVALVSEGVWVGDRLGRGAVLALADTPLAARVDPSIPSWHLGYGVHLLLVSVAAWRQRALTLRAAVVETAGRRIGVAGWSGGGKTRIVLELLRRGGSLVGDDVVALAPDGTVHPLLAELTVRPGHADQLPPTVRPAAGRRALSQGLEAAARLSGRSRTLSEVTARLADVARSASERTVAVSSVFPGTRLGEAGRLDAMLLLREPGLGRVDAAQALASLTGSYHLLHRATELAALHRWSDRLREPLLPPFSARRAAFAAALEGVAVLEAAPAADQTAAATLADRLTEVGA